VKALSKYQFETATTVGMRHAFHRPLRPAFHFYLYLPGGVGPSSRRIPMSPGHPAVRDRKGVSRRCALFIFYDILFPIRRRSAQEGITWHLGPYSTFMALNRDEVSREWTNLATNSLLFLSLSLPFSFLFHPILTCEGFTWKVKSENFIAAGPRDYRHFILFLFFRQISIKINIFFIYKFFLYIYYFILYYFLNRSKIFFTLI